MTLANHNPPPVPTNQVRTTQIDVMTRVINLFSHPIQALEIGTWFAEGSTQIWLNNLPERSSLTLVDPWQPYASENDFNDTGFDYAMMDGMVTDAFLSTYLNVKKFENVHPGRVDVEIFRGKSQNVCRKLADNSFDFIYIDGDHKYDSVKSDIVEAKRLIKSSNAIICGDDLDRLPTPELLEIARQHKSEDALRPPLNFHPGVMLAVHEEFESVNMFNTFWWVYVRDGKFHVS